jgi:hypothetical protein
MDLICKDILEKELQYKTPKEVVFIPFYSDTSNYGPFGRYLIENRIYKFITLDIIRTHCIDSQFNIAFEKARYQTYVEEGQTPEITQLGNAILPKKIEWDELFDSLVSKLQFGQLVTAKALDWNLGKWNTVTGTCVSDDPSFGRHCEDTYIIPVRHPSIVAINQAGVFVTDTQAIMPLIQAHHKQWEEFLQEAEEYITIPHEHFLEYLLAWFGSLIKIRSLE